MLNLSFEQDDVPGFFLPPTLFDNQINSVNAKSKKQKSTRKQLNVPQVVHHQLCIWIDEGG